MIRIAISAHSCIISHTAHLAFDNLLTSKEIASSAALFNHPTSNSTFLPHLLIVHSVCQIAPATGQDNPPPLLLPYRIDVAARSVVGIHQAKNKI